MATESITDRLAEALRICPDFFEMEPTPLVREIESALAVYDAAKADGTLPDQQLAAARAEVERLREENRKLYQIPVHLRPPQIRPVFPINPDDYD